jgi:hypothetical protein
MGLKTSAPACYGVSNTFKTEPDIANAARANVGGKATARFKNTPQTPNKSAGGGGGMVKHRAYSTDGSTG